jgi:hypothetical protein
MTFTQRPILEGSSNLRWKQYTFIQCVWESYQLLEVKLPSQVTWFQNAAWTGTNLIRPTFHGSYRSFVFYRSAWLQQLQNTKQFLLEMFHIRTKIFTFIWKFPPKTEYKTFNRQKFNVSTLVSKVRPQTTGKAFWMPWYLAHIARWMQNWHNSYGVNTTKELIKYRVIHKSLRNFRTQLHNNQDRHSRKEHINRCRISPSFFFFVYEVPLRTCKFHR